MNDATPEPRDDDGARRARLPGPLRAGLWMVFGALLTVAAAAGTAAIAWPLLEQHPDWVADWLGGQIGRKVDIRAMDLRWQGGGPVVRLHDLTIETGAAGTPALAMDAAEVRIDALGSLRRGALQPRSITVRGAGLDLERGANGAITLAGFGLDAARRADEVLLALIGSLPQGATFALEDTHLALHGVLPGTTASGPPLVLDPVSLHLRADPSGLRLAGAVTPRADADAMLRFALRWADRTAPPLDAARLVVHSRRFPLDALPPALVPADVGGRLDLEAEAELDAGDLVSLRGTAVLRDAQLGPGDLRADAVESLVDFQQHDAGWTLSLLRLRARTGSERSAPTTLTLARRAADPAHHYRAGIDHLPAATLLALARDLGAVTPAADLLDGLTARGRVTDLALRLHSRDGALSPVAVDASFHGAVLAHPAGPLRIGPADFTLHADTAGGELTLAPSPVAVDDPQRPALELAAGGSLGWALDGDAVRVHSDGIDLADGTSRLRLAGSLWLPVRTHAPPRLAITASGSDLDASRVKRQLPGLGLPGALETWLTAAVHEGQISSLEVTLDGTLDELAALGGTVTARARLESAVLEYHPGWPKLEDLSGQITLDGPHLELVLERGRVAGARIVQARVGIADVTHDARRVTVNGRVTGLTQHGAAFLAATPMAARFAGLLKQLDARGRAALALALDIPLNNGRSRVDGVVTLDGNTLEVGGLRTGLEDVGGEIRFDRQGLRDGTLKASYLGRRIEARIDGTRGERDRTLLTIDGTSDPESLVLHLHDVGALESADARRLPLLSRLAGTTRWQVELDMAHTQPLAGDGIELSVRSDLDGMALDLPPPLGKRPAERRALEVRTNITESGPRLFRIRYGDDMAALLERDAGTAARGLRLRRGEVRFGGEPRLPADDGVRVAGAVDLLSVDGWVALIADAAKSVAEADAPLARVTGVDVHARRLVALGAGFDDVQVTMTQGDGGDLQITALGESVDGTIRVPVPVGSAPIDARFRTLVVTPASGVVVSGLEQRRSLDPRALPDAHVVAERLAYGDVELGLAKLIMRATADGIELAELFTLNPTFELRGTGRWSVAGERSRSRFDLRIHSSDFGRLSKVLGYGDSGVEGGVSDVALEASWNGTPFDFGLDRVKGVLHFRATEGRLRDVEPGATGRVFGLLNVAVLPRRLLYLDFNDLFEEGIRYDLIEGSFRFDHGNAHTDNITMHTQSARIDLSGRVGLVAEDYDQVMTVTPKLSASLPLAPLWLAEKFLNRKLIDSAFAYRYIISGNWDDPKVERVKVEAERSDAG